MRTTTKLMKNWQFTGPDGKTVGVDLPHTWNNIDGQDGGNDYWRGTCTYKTQFAAPAFDADAQQVWLQFEGVNASAKVMLNGQEVMTHDGGYSTFRADVTALLNDSNELVVEADNSKNDRVYPQKADFTFYGGIYRDVTLIVINKNHIAMGHLGGPGVKITPTVNGNNADINVKTLTEGDGEVEFSILDANGIEVLAGKGSDTTVTLEHPHLWDGVRDPYLYTCVVRLVLNGEVQDEVKQRFGVRSFSVDPKKGFFLNGRSYPLHGVSRHQDRKGLGNAITREMHDEDMQLIKELGANTIRLAHYQHDQYFYDLCDEAGMVVWAEIPYISEHMPNGRENTISQMKELITQNYNHACIVCWGVSNEITISTKDNRDMRDNHHVLNDLCHEMDKTRLTTLACYAMCGPFNPVAHITDLVSWNLYLGWYVPGLFLNDLWMDFFHLCYPNRALGFSEYGAEGMPNLHSNHPHRGDHTEEYQAIYHEYMLRCFDRHKWLWATHVWNMYDFAADARDQGGEPGMNHKGLVTFDRKTKKDSFYIYKAWWSDEPFVHICSKRFVDRTQSEIEVKVYSNRKNVTLYVNGEKLAEQEGEHIFKFRVKLNGETKVQAVAGDCIDDAVFRKVDAPNPDYKLAKKKSTSANWV
ncbi:glycoside hydrolase family 2 protein [Gemmiger sp.]